MFRKSLQLLIAAGVCLGSTAFGATIISNLSAAGLSDPGVGAVDYSNPAEVGTLFTMGGTSFNNVSFTLGLEATGNRSLGPLDVTVQIFGGDTTSLSGSALLTVAPTGSYNGAVNYYTFTAPTDFTLDANTNYWIVATSVQDQEGWVTFPNTVANRQPKGLFATAPLGFNRSGSGLPTSIFSPDGAVVYGVDGTAVTGNVGAAPEPSTFAMIAIALAGSALIRRRARQG